MPEPFNLYVELKAWQSGIAALVGFTGLMVAALWNFHLNRLRDAAIRHQEMLSVAAALYGEILLLREDVARIARVVANLQMHGRQIDAQFASDYQLRDPIMYPALAAKLGLLPADLVLEVTRFHKNYADAKGSLPQIVQEGRGVALSSLAVLEPAIAAVNNVKPALRRFEWLTGTGEAADPDTGHADDIAERERESFRSARARTE